ncbi:hypothetical protein GF360_00815 [candidate division WWE3 bacterium]|nr:hypothetical protein [candidate division WWE3 bacterium]
MALELATYLDSLSQTLKKEGYSTEESFLKLPFDEDNLREVMEATKNLNVTDVFVIGIGGSSLGTKAIYEALFSYTNPSTKLHFLDQINVEKIQYLVKDLEKKDPKKTAFITISKSGKTLETRKNYELLKEHLPWKAGFHEILITGKDSEFPINREKATTLTIPQEVGGRFSVFSPVGLVPLALTKIDVVQLLKGAMQATKEISENPEKTIKNVTEVFENYKNGKKIYNIFVFSPKLKTLAFWYQQLLGESLGKENKGFFPAVSEGSKDLHSLQQYFAGGTQNTQHEFLISKDENKYQQTIMKAVQETYKEKQIPFRTHILEETNEEELGKFMQTKMMEVLLLAKLLEVNPFGQPDVEAYKSKTRELLANENL